METSTVQLDWEDRPQREQLRKEKKERGDKELTVKPDYLFKLEEEPGLMTIEQIMTKIVQEEFKQFENRVAEVFDTKNGKYAEQYESVGHIRVADAVKKFG